MAFTDVQVALDAQAVNGEGPQWCDARERLFWVDMRRPSLNMFDPATSENASWEMPGWIGCYGLMLDGRLAVALRTGLYLFEPDSGGLSLLAAAPYDPRRLCFNDGGCDRAGHFLVGPFFEPLGPEPGGEAEEGPVWRYAGVDRWIPTTRPVKIANGLAFSPDGRTLYHSDTARKTIWACDYDPGSGDAGPPRVFATVEEGGESGGPDGAVIDKDGFYTCAVFGGGVLLRFDPTGALERRIELPVRYPTMPALGGAGRDTLFVTSASYPLGDERQAHPLAGALLAMEAPAAGLPTSYMTPPEELGR